MWEYEWQEQQEQDEFEVVENWEYIIDFIVYEKDLVYWAIIWLVLFIEIEACSYEKLDSMVKKEKVEEEVDLLVFNSNSGKFGFLGDIFLGSFYKVGENQLVFYMVLLFCIYFNFVEGFSFYIDIGYVYKKDDCCFFVILMFCYVFVRQKLIGKVVIGYFYGDYYIGVDVGWYIYCYNGDWLIGFFFNIYVNLFIDCNFICLYEKDYLWLFYYQQFRENFFFDFLVEWANCY